MPNIRGKNAKLMLNEKQIEHCKEYKYLGIPTPLPNNYIKLLCDRLSQRLRPLKTLANRIAGVNINLCRSFYIAYVRSLVDYNSLHLATLSHSTLRPLETLQNRAMRIILGCPSSTRIVLMQNELNLPPLYDYIQQAATITGVKIAKSVNDSNTHEDTPNTLRRMIIGELTYDKEMHPKIFSVIVNNARKHNVRLFPEDEDNEVINPVDRVPAEIHIPLIPDDSVNHVNIVKTAWLESLEEILSKRV